ncbi:NAD(P)/FAD-dependent oxidoreductase [Halostreptopolyspora alba]|uniref:NAD(P)/FAD-dependent oxidoreductase n=1 Tax=Halostreptopolyspora alba TaxID=2487137 RepID=A0A3N0E593_9ACTN|nr:NAD(P)/FAD-dependent oxidoreductase [Nocardiopsaceae bacterium YIM 96095]
MYDVIVVGGGPAGLSAALVFGRQRRDVLVVDGGAVRNAPATEMHMLLSRDGHPPADFLEIGRGELANYPSVEARSGTVAAAAGEIDAFEVTLDDGTRERGRRVVLATGQVDEPYEIPGLAQRFGSCVFHCPFCHGWESSGRALAVINRDPEDAMLAGYLADRFSSDVVLCTHGAEEPPEEVTSKLDALGVTIDPTPVAEVGGELGDVTVRFTDGRELSRGAVFHRAPTRQHSLLARELGCEILDDGTVRVDEFQQTTVPGVSAAGDTAKLPALPTPTTLVVLGAGDGVRAALWMDGGLFRSDLEERERAAS